MEALLSTLILTKLRVPTPRASNLPRTHLMDRLGQNPGTGLILVCAPAGYGKTTLLSEWAQSLMQKGVAVAWVAIDSSDDAPIPFGAYLIASLAQALGSISDLTRIAQLLRSSPELDLQKTLPTIINVISSSDRDCVLILDDYHLLGSPAIHAAVAFLLEHCPENLRIVLGSRSDPPLPLARLRARRQLLEIRAADLRFTPDETVRFLNEVMHLDLSVDVIAILEQRTEGWAAGLQLAALSLTGRSDKESFLSSFTGSHRYLVEFLLEEVVNHQPENVQSFLLYTSILERLCGPLCDAILGEGAKSSSSTLDYLEHSNLFLIPLDDEQQWYRYHHLFRDFLQTRLQKNQPERVAALHRAASEWHAAHGFLHEAVEHALQTRDWDFAAALVEQQGVAMALRGEFSTLYEWCSAFPEEVMRVHPSLCLFQANTLVIGYRRQNRGRIEARLRQVEQAAEAIEDRQLARLLMGQAATTRVVMEAVTPDPLIAPRAQIPLAQKTLDLLSEDDPARSTIALTTGYAYMALHDAAAGDRAIEESRQLALASHNYFGFVEATFHRSRLAHAQGQLHYAADTCLHGRADASAILARSDQELPSAGCLDIALGCVQLEQDHLEEAERNLLAGLELVGWGTNPYYVMTACLTLFRLCEIQGRSEDALNYLTRLEESWPDIAFCTRGFRVIHTLRTSPEDPSTLAEARMWCEEFVSSLDEHMSPPGMGPFGAAEAYYLAYLAWVRAQIHIGNPKITLSYLERQLDQAVSHGLMNRVIELSLLEAEARQAEGDSKGTWAALERALSAAEPEGYVRIFDQGPALTQLLVEAAERGLYRDFIKQILAIVEISKTSDKVRELNTPLADTETGVSKAYSLKSGEQLSERELEVLRLMASGATNHQIAQQLVITVGTVKSHINHILRKLDAHNRTEAVARARRLGPFEI